VAWRSYSNYLFAAGRIEYRIRVSRFRPASNFLGSNWNLGLPWKTPGNTVAPVLLRNRWNYRNDSLAVKMTVIDDYLKKVPAAQRKMLEDLRKEMRKLLPDAEEAISYGLPCFKVAGKVVGGFAANKNFCSYYPFAGTTLGLLKKDLEGYSQTLSALHFTEEKPLTKKIIKLLVDTKLQQIAEGYHAKKKK
jgi:uncharacterized protein YdhG (YjbR/CyaY superfamily)